MPNWKKFPLNSYFLLPILERFFFLSKNLLNVSLKIILTHHSFFKTFWTSRSVKFLKGLRQHKIKIKIRDQLLLSIIIIVIRRRRNSLNIIWMSLLFLIAAYKMICLTKKSYFFVCIYINGNDDASRLCHHWWYGLCWYLFDERRQRQRCWRPIINSVGNLKFILFSHVMMSMRSPSSCFSTISHRSLILKGLS